MGLKDVQEIELPATADFHVHLRDGEMMNAVVPTIRQGGVNTVFVMPNLSPPITTVKHALAYKASLQALEPNVNFLMSLYLHPSITPSTIIEAKAAGISGVKSYPAGVTTNSSSGVVNYEEFYPVFAEMETQNLVLNLHGECPSARGSGITVLNAEERFLPTLMSIHKRFPKLRIILEHCTTAAAVAAVQQCGPTVAGTITAHHLFLTIDDVVGNNAHFCKPVAKTDEDRTALLRTAVSGSAKFFLGTDSAPHPLNAKIGVEFGVGCAAGVFTQPYATQIVIDALEAGIDSEVIKDTDITQQKLEGFLSGYGRAFYGVTDPKEERITLKRDNDTIMTSLVKGSVEVVPFRAKKRTWSLKWQ